MYSRFIIIGNRFELNIGNVHLLFTNCNCILVFTNRLKIILNKCRFSPVALEIGAGHRRGTYCTFDTLLMFNYFCINKKLNTAILKPPGITESNGYEVLSGLRLLSSIPLVRRTCKETRVRYSGSRYKRGKYR